jgi:hypothetical protein
MKFNNNPVGLYKREDPMLEFRAFLNRAEDNNVPPAWWSAQRRGEVEGIADNRDQLRSVHKAVGKEDIIALHNGDSQMPMKLRGLAERVYGTPVQR